MNWLKKNLTHITIAFAIILLFFVAYLIGEHLPGIGDNLADLLEFALICLFIVFIVSVLAQPFFKNE